MIAAILLALAVTIAPGALRTRCRLSGAADGQVVASRRYETGLLSMAFSLDVLAVCLRSGMTVPASALAVAPLSPQNLAALLRHAGELLALGAPAATAWSHEGASTAVGYEQCQTLVRLARRGAESGSAMAGGIADLASQCRTEAVDSAVASAERAGVLIGAPLGLCFLPSFVCLGIVPVVMGLASDVFGGGLL